MLSGVLRCRDAANASATNGTGAEAGTGAAAAGGGAVGPQRLGSGDAERTRLAADSLLERPGLKARPRSASHCMCPWEHRASAEAFPIRSGSIIFGIMLI